MHHLFLFALVWKVGCGFIHNVYGMAQSGKIKLCVARKEHSENTRKQMVMVDVCECGGKMKELIY